MVRSAWHSDGGWSPALPLGRADPEFEDHSGGCYYPGVKAAVYLDELRADSGASLSPFHRTVLLMRWVRAGALRVVPGSHISPLHESLSPLHSQLANADPSAMPDAISAQLEAGGFLEAPWARLRAPWTSLGLS